LYLPDLLHALIARYGILIHLLQLVDMADANSVQHQLVEALSAFKKWEQKDELTYPEGEPDALTITDSDVDSLQPRKFLSDNIINFYIKYLQRTRLSSTERDRFFFLNSLFFTELLENSSASTDFDQCRVDYGQLRTWTQGVDLFEKEYIFIPVIQGSHWSLILICHLTSLKRCREESKLPPCIYHVSSMIGGHESSEREIKRYLLEAWLDGKHVVDEDQFHHLRALNGMRVIQLEVCDYLHCLCGYLNCFISKRCCSYDVCLLEH
jgi:sentrin-specific protease 7